jgi:hypothetical protein
MWLRSRSQPLKLGEIVQAVLILSFAFVIPVLLVPTIVVLSIVLLDRLGLTLFGKTAAILVVAAIIWICLVAFGYIAGG